MTDNEDGKGMEMTMADNKDENWLTMKRGNDWQWQ